MILGRRYFILKRYCAAAKRNYRRTLQTSEMFEAMMNLGNTIPSPPPMSLLHLKNMENISI